MFRFRLRSKIIFLFSAMGMVTLAGGVIMLWYTYQIDNTLRDVIRKEMVLYEIARNLELALANQKGFLTYYLIDGDGKWLESLGKYRQVFTQNLERSHELELSDQQRQDLDVISRLYSSYINKKDMVIAQYRESSTNGKGSISNLHERQRDDFFALLENCRQFSADQWKVIERIKQTSKNRSRALRESAFAAIALFLVLGGFFLFILYKHILGPIRGLALETGSSPQESSRDEVVSLSQSLKGMMRDMDETHDELARSRKHLLQAERMAMVGELAAGVAHTIRNPFTSIKMRMFSLTRSLELDHAQNEDLTVIAEEIARIDKIVQNFLEFARPPKIKLEECRLSDLIRSVMSLLEYRLKEYEAELRYIQQPDFPNCLVDPDRIKEALVNLITNSCEAMAPGGVIEISERLEMDEDIGLSAAISVRDNGPGVPEGIRHKIMTPFFTTKEEGSGLGLSIVNRIAKEHKGKLLLSPTAAGSAEFILKIPIKGIPDEQDTHN